MDAAEYKHVVLGLLFLKYLSDALVAQRAELKKQFTDPNSEYYLDTSDTDEINTELEDRDYYSKDNVYWVPKTARWDILRDMASSPNFGKRIDDALRAIEDDNKKLKGILNKIYANIPLDNASLGEIETQESNNKDFLGLVYEYFLGKFARDEGKRGGQFYTPIGGRYMICVVDRGVCLYKPCGLWTNTIMIKTIFPYMVRNPIPPHGSWHI